MFTCLIVSASIVKAPRPSLYISVQNIMLRKNIFNIFSPYKFEEKHLVVFLRKYPTAFAHPSNYCHSAIQLRRNSLPLIKSRQATNSHNCKIVLNLSYAAGLIVCWRKSLQQKFIFQPNPITGGGSVPWNVQHTQRL